MTFDEKKALSITNHKSAFLFFVRKKLFKPVYVGKISKFTGYQTILLLKTKGYESFDLDIEIIEGEATMLLIQNKQYHIMAEETCKKSMNFDIEPGWIRIRLIGQRAKVKFNLTRYIK